MTQDLGDRVCAVCDRETLSVFIDAFRVDMRDRPEAYENVTLDRFLEALSAFTADLDGVYLNRGEIVPEQPTWRLLAEVLLGAGIYE